jgi:hypothetical protein
MDFVYLDGVSRHGCPWSGRCGMANQLLERRRRSFVSYSFCYDMGELSCLDDDRACCTCQSPEQQHERSQPYICTPETRESIDPEWRHKFCDYNNHVFYQVCRLSRMDNP